MSRKRHVYADKMALLAAGARIMALVYARASQDEKKREKSVGDQLDLGKGEAGRNGWTVLKTYFDNNISASKYARIKKRPDYEVLLEDIESGEGDVLIMFELARSNRDLAVYVHLRELCIRVGLYFWLIGGQLYDLRVRADLMSLGFQAVQAEDQSVATHENVKRGKYGAAMQGLPPGKLNFGYRRIYDEKTGAFVAQLPDDEPQEGIRADGSIYRYTRAKIISNVFERLDAGIAIHRIEDDLATNGVLSLKGGHIGRAVIRKWALNPVYIGKSVHLGEVVGQGQWERLVSDELYWSVNELLNSEKRFVTRAGSGKYVLSYIGLCDNCGSPISGQPPVEKGSYITFIYRCYRKNCWSLPMEELDSFILSTVAAWCSREDIEELLLATFSANDEALSDARAEVKRIESEWEAWLKEAALAKTKPTIIARFEMQYEAEIAAARDRANELSMPSLLRNVIGPQAERKIMALEIEAKRELIRILGPFSVTKALRKDNIPLTDRVQWHGLLGSEFANGESDS
ncbi:recombinase family protein [Kribbella antibiotica]|uniref:Recombinase family protein n=1 Tax=Kribbella antibiotica TaxID=190195 RepID=A0A4R4ZU35_9ACTN|nr:recombinase family protein [Kribbella antibiotica]TDD61980.1 recombinase family protein [Kribbella antibiotica]